MDGSRDVNTLKIGFELRTGTPLSNSSLEKLISTLDEALLLDNRRFAEAHTNAVEEFRLAPSRATTLPGRCCPADPQELGKFLQQYLDQVDDAAPYPASKVRGLISPHIDFPRGGPVYAGVWAKVAAAAKEAELVVILGTDHAGGEARVTLTRQSYATPWGTMPTAQDLVAEIAQEAGEEVLSNELHHRNEHSVEAAATWLHHLLGGARCSLLPVLCGSFQTFIERSVSPSEDPLICATVRVLKEVSDRRRTLFVAAADLAHVGPVFGDLLPLDAVARASLENKDRRLIEVLSNAEAEPFYQEIREEGDQRRICGMPPLHLMLSVLTGVKGSPTGYAQCPASEDGGSQVSICGMVYHS